MISVVLIGLAAWAAVATVTCVSVCMAASRFYREVDADEADAGSGLGQLSHG
jgi:hypothetical protein